MQRAVLIQTVLATQVRDPRLTFWLSSRIALQSKLSTVRLRVGPLRERHGAHSDRAASRRLESICDLAWREMLALPLAMSS